MNARHDSFRMSIFTCRGPSLPRGASSRAGREGKLGGWWMAGGKALLCSSTGRFAIGHVCETDLSRLVGPLFSLMREDRASESRAPAQTEHICTPRELPPLGLPWAPPCGRRRPRVRAQPPAHARARWCRGETPLVCAPLEHDSSRSAR